MVAAAVPERMDTNSHRIRAVPFHAVVSPLSSFACNPTVNRPLAGTADTGTSYVTTAQPAVTHVASVGEIGRPRTTSSGAPAPTFDWELQPGLPSRALTQSERTCPRRCRQSGIFSFWAMPRPDRGLPTVVCAR